MMGGIDLDAYFERIGYGGPRAASLEVLRALCLAHAGAIPFENLDPLFGWPVRIDPESLERKLVRSRRGGYCFEQNNLFWRVLTALGFGVTPLAARVRWMLPEDAPPTALSHMMLKVDADEGAFVCDVGFGGQSPTGPLRFEPGLEQATPHGTYRLMPHGSAFDLQMRLPERWSTMYRFTLEPRVLADYEVSNWFTSTHPNSRFVNNLVASRVVGEARLNLFNRELTTHRADGRTERAVLEGPAEVHQALTRDFGIDASRPDLERVFSRLPGPEAATA